MRGLLLVLTRQITVGRVGRLKKIICSTVFAFGVQYFSPRGTALLHRCTNHSSFCNQWTVRSAFAAAAFQGTGLTLPAQQHHAPSPEPCHERQEGRQQEASESPAPAPAPAPRRPRAGRRAGAAPAPAAARVWRSAKDPKTGRTYYYDVLTRETRWTKPRELQGEAERRRPTTRKRNGASSSTRWSATSERTSPRD